MIDDNAKLTVELAAFEWNVVLNTLAKGPFELVATLIGKIRQQCLAADPEHSPDRPGNGVDAHAPN